MSETMTKTWGDIFKNFGKESGILYDSIADWRPCIPPYYEIEIPNTLIIWLKNGDRILYTPKRTVFEVGKCYEHTDGTKMRIIAEVDTHFYGHGLLGETDTCNYAIVGDKEEHAVNWKECEDFGKDGCAGWTLEERRMNMNSKKIITQIEASDYDKLKKDDEIELVVVATNREPMKIFASRYPLEANKPDYSGYENAVFNGEI